jgi:hypothetical protein
MLNRCAIQRSVIVVRLRNAKASCTLAGSPLRRCSISRSVQPIRCKARPRQTPGPIRLRLLHRPAKMADAGSRVYLRLAGLLQGFQEAPPALIAGKNGLAPVAAMHDMADRARILDAHLSSHRLSLIRQTQ